MAKSYFHRGGETPLLGLTIPEHFADVVARFPNRDAVISVPQQQQLTYVQLSEQIDVVARGLLSFGFGKGDRIGICSTNNLQWILMQMATARIGAILVNINPAYRLWELGFTTSRLSSAKSLFFQQIQIKPLQTVREKTGKGIGGVVSSHHDVAGILEGMKFGEMWDKMHKGLIGEKVQCFLIFNRTCPPSHPYNLPG